MQDRHVVRSVDVVTQPLGEQPSCSAIFRLRCDTGRATGKLSPQLDFRDQDGRSTPVQGQQPLIWVQLRREHRQCDVNPPPGLIAPPT
jgi:hypothetical protein